MKRHIIQMLLGMLLLHTLSFGQDSLTDTQVAAAVNSAFTGKRHQIGLALNDMQTNLFSGLVCKTCKTSGYTIFVYSPESWIELQAVQARREMLPFGLSNVTPEMRLSYIHVLASPSRPEYLNANGMAMASSVHRIVLSSTDRTDVVQPLSESRSAVESNSALRSFTQASAGAVFSLEDVDRLRSKDQKGEFFIVVVGDNLNKYFKVKTRFFNQLFGHTSYTQSEEAKAILPQAAGRKPTIRNTFGGGRAEAALPPSVTGNAPKVPGVSAESTPGFSASSGNALNSGIRTVSPQSQNGAVLLGLVVTTWEQYGAEIMKITPDSAADLVGLHVGDVIVSVEGKRVRSASDFAAALVNRAPGSKIRLGYMFPNNLGWMPGAERVLTLHE
jgi:hypothetical protein